MLRDHIFAVKKGMVLGGHTRDANVTIKYLVQTSTPTFFSDVFAILSRVALAAPTFKLSQSISQTSTDEGQTSFTLLFFRVVADHSLIFVCFT